MSKNEELPKIEIEFTATFKGKSITDGEEIGGNRYNETLVNILKDITNEKDFLKELKKNKILQWLFLYDSGYFSGGEIVSFKIEKIKTRFVEDKK